MEAAPTMQSFITRLAEKHGFDLESRTPVRLEVQMPGSAGLPLLIVPWFAFQEVRVHHAEPGGKSHEAKPGVTFFTNSLTGGGVWIPTHVWGGRLGKREYATFNDFDYALEPLGDAEGQADLAACCEEWARRLEKDGWLEGAIRKS